LISGPSLGCRLKAFWRVWKSWEENMKKSGSDKGRSASELIDKRIAELGDWRGKTLSRMRKLIKEADPDVVEEWKWMGTPTWSHDGIICTGGPGQALQLEPGRERQARDRHR
jgi:hypothetical protein